MPNSKPPELHRMNILLLTLVAGSADALGYLNLDKVFTSNMTGNLVLMGISVSEGRGADTWRSLFAFIAFIAGNCLGAYIISHVSRKDPPTSGITAAIGCEALLLFAFALVSALVEPVRSAVTTYLIIALLGLAMGFQSSAVYRLGTPGVTTTAITGTLTTLFAGLIKTIVPAAKMAPEQRGKPAPFALQVSVIALYFGGAAISGALNLHAQAQAVFFPVIVVTALFFYRLLWR